MNTASLGGGSGPDTLVSDYIRVYLDKFDIRYTAKIDWYKKLTEVFELVCIDGATPNPHFLARLRTIAIITGINTEFTEKDDEFLKTILVGDRELARKLFNKIKTTIIDGDNDIDNPVEVYAALSVLASRIYTTLCEKYATIARTKQ